VNSRPFPTRRLNVLGFLSRDNRAFFSTVVGTVDSLAIIKALDGFAAWRGNAKPCVVVLDNATWHTSQAIRDRVADWAGHGIVLHYLPTYSPELNLIETLWRRIKYDWLPLTAYQTFDTLTQAVQAVLNGIGSEYKISFV